jgi:hypothetical protein
VTIAKGLTTTIGDKLTLNTNLDVVKVVNSKKDLTDPLLFTPKPIHHRTRALSFLPLPLPLSLSLSHGGGAVDPAPFDLNCSPLLLGRIICLLWISDLSETLAVVHSKSSLAHRPARQEH